MNIPSVLGDSRNYNTGDIIFHQDDTSDGVFMIKSGSVQVTRKKDNELITLATLEAGELVGETSVIENMPHSVTAKAIEPTSLLFIDAAAFKRSFTDPLIKHVLQTLAARLRNSYVIIEKLNKASKEAMRSVEKQSIFPTIEGLSRLVADKFLTYAEIKKTPYIVGNTYNIWKKTVSKNNRLKIPLAQHRTFAKKHFAIVTHDSSLYIRDLGSEVGTTVNGNFISQKSSSRAPAAHKLKTGKNEVTCGKSDSAIRFSITVHEDQR